LWGHFAVNDRPSYFSLLLDPNPQGKNGPPSFDHLLITPQADAMTEHFTGTPINGNRAPLLSKIEFENGAKSRLAAPGETMKLTLAAEDSNQDTIDFVTWILNSKVRKTKTVSGPVTHPPGKATVLNAPEAPGDYLVMVYAIDNKGGGSASALPFKVETPKNSVDEIAEP
jgi:hypothetical protein